MSISNSKSFSYDDITMIFCIALIYDNYSFNFEYNYLFHSYLFIKMVDK